MGSINRSLNTHTNTEKHIDRHGQRRHAASQPQYRMSAHCKRSIKLNDSCPIDSHWYSSKHARLKSTCVFASCFLFFFYFYYYSWSLSFGPSFVLPKCRWSWSCIRGVNGKRTTIWMERHRFVTVNKIHTLCVGAVKSMLFHSVCAFPGQLQSIKWWHFWVGDEHLLLVTYSIRYKMRGIFFFLLVFIRRSSLYISLSLCIVFIDYWVSRGDSSTTGSQLFGTVGNTQHP